MASFLHHSSRSRLTAAAALGLTLALCLGAIRPDPAHAKPTVEEVSFDARADGRGYVVRLHTTGAVSGYSEARRVDGGWLEVQLFNVALGRAYHRADPAGPVRAYDAQERGGHVVFRFELDPEIDVDAAVYRDAASSDILLGLSYRPDEPMQVPVPVRAVSSTERPSLPVETSSAEVARAEGERWRLDTIVIDAGHGGKDPGAMANGVREKDVTLAVAHKLGGYIERELGVDVLYTRDDDRFIELKDRGSFANAHGAKLFISLHINSAADPRAYGTETYFLGMHKTEAAKRVMERENEVVQYESDPDQYDALDEQALIRQALLQSANMRKSEQLAGLVEHQFAERVGRRSRGVKQAGFYVLWGASMPAVLVELGFLSNPAEARFLSSDDGQTYMASALFRAVRAYKEQYEKGILVHSR